MFNSGLPLADEDDDDNDAVKVSEILSVLGNACKSGTQKIDKTIICAKSFICLGVAFYRSLN